MNNAVPERKSISVASKYDPDVDVVLYSGDAYSLLQTIPSDSVSLIVTSPPYNLGKEYEEEIELVSYLETQRRVIAELCRVLKEDGSICWQVGNYVKNGEVYPLDIFYYAIFKELGLSLRNRIVWHFGHGLHASKRFSGRYETILWFTKTDRYKFNLDPVRIRAKYPGKRHSKGHKKSELSGNPKGKNPADVWEILADDWESGFWQIPNVKASHLEKTVHPCQFPVELVERCILALTDQNDVVFDPYVGVGSSIIAAIKHGRKAIGSDKEERYLDIAKERIKQYCDGSLKLRPLGQPVFEPKGASKIAQIPESWRTHEDSIYFDNID